MSIEWPTPPGPAPRKAPTPLPMVRVTSTANGAVMPVSVGLAAYLVLTGGAELLDTLTSDQQPAFDAATAAYSAIPAIARTTTP